MNLENLSLVEQLRARIVRLEMALSEIAEGRVEGFEVGDDGAVFFLQERARKALLNPFKLGGRNVGAGRSGSNPS